MGFTSFPMTSMKTNTHNLYCSIRKCNMVICLIKTLKEEYNFCGQLYICVNDIGDYIAEQRILRSDWLQVCTSHRLSSLSLRIKQICYTLSKVLSPTVQCKIGMKANVLVLWNRENYNSNWFPDLKLSEVVALLITVQVWSWLSLACEDCWPIIQYKNFNAILMG